MDRDEALANAQLWDSPVLLRLTEAGFPVAVPPSPQELVALDERLDRAGEAAARFWADPAGYDGPLIF